MTLSEKIKDVSSVGQKAAVMAVFFASVYILYRGQVNTQTLIDTRLPTTVVAPLEVPAVVDTVVKPPISWIVLKDGKRIDDPAIEEIFKKLVVGEYTGIGIPEKGESIVNRSLTISGGTQPRPPPPVNPVVDPSTPKPDEPNPDTTLIPKDKFRVIFAYESRSGDKTNAFAFDPEVRKYLDTHCAPNATAKVPDRRYWDWNNTDTTKDPSPAIRQLWANAKTKVSKVPALIIGNDVEPLVFEPQSIEEAKTILKKYGGE